MIGTLHVLSFGLYGSATALLGISLAREARRLPAVATGILALGLVIHALALADYASRWDQLPLVGLGPFFSTLAFLTGLGLLMAATFGHASTVGIVLAPLVALFTGVAALVGVVPTGEPTTFRGAWFVLHVIFACIGYVGLTVAFAAGLMYLLQFRELKSKHFGAIFRFFPPLETLDRLGRQGLLVGFPFLTLAVVLGWAWASNFEGAPGVGKLAWVIISWVILLSALLARVGPGRRAERGAMASVIGFVVVVVLYVVLRSQAVQQGAFL